MSLTTRDRGQAHDDSVASQQAANGWAQQYTAGAFDPADPSRKLPLTSAQIAFDVPTRRIDAELDTPQASSASLAKKLQAEGIALHAAEVRRIVEFYALGKKTAR